MLEISMLVLILQIGFNAGLNNGGYNSNPIPIPQRRSIPYGQSRRGWNSNSYQPQTSDRISSSESDQSYSEETSSEENSFQSQHLHKSLPYERNTNLRYNTRTINDVSLETAPIGILGLNSRSDFSKNRADTDFRRPYLRHRPLNLRRAQNVKYRKKGDSDGSSVNGVVAATAGEDANYLRSLLTLIQQPLRRDQSRKYYREGADLSLEMSPDSLELDEDTSSSLPTSRAADTPFSDSFLSSFESSNYRRIGKNLKQPRTDKLMLDNNAKTNYRRSLQSDLQSPNSRQNNRKNNKSSNYNVRFEIPPASDNPDAYIDTVLLVSGKGKPDDIAIARPQLRKSGGTNLNKNNKYNRRYDDSSTFELSSDDRFSADDELRLSPDDDDIDKITVLSLASLDDLKLESPQLRSRDQKQQKNKQYMGRSFLRLALSPNEKLSLDEDMALSLSKLLSENLDNLKLVPISLRSSKPTNWKDTRRTYDDTKLDLSLEDKINSEDDTLGNISLDSSDELSIELPVMRNFSPNKNDKSMKDNDNTGLKLLLTSALNDNHTPVDNLVPYHEFALRSNNETLNNNTLNEKQNDTRGNNNDLNLSLLNKREDDDDDDNSKSVLLIDRLEHDDNLEDSTYLRSFRLNTPGLKSSNENQSNEHDTTNILYLEFPNDQLSPDDNQSNKLTFSNGSESGLRNRDPNDQSTDLKDYELKLEFPWNDQPSPDDESGKDLINPGLRNGDQTDRQNMDPKNYELELEFPWNGQLSPGDESSKDSRLRGLKTKLRNYEEKYRQSIDPKDYELKLEFPWNDQLTPDDESGKDSANRGLRKRLRNREQTDRYSIDPKDYELDIEYPWNDQLSPGDESSQNSKLRGLKTKLRNYEKIYRQSKDPIDYELKLEYPWNGQQSPDDESGKDSSNRGLRKTLRNREQADHSIDPKDYELNLEFPWTGQLSSDEDTLSVNRRTNHDSYYSYQRNRNRINNLSRRSNNNFYNNYNRLKRLGDSLIDAKSYLRRSDGSFKDEQSLRVLPITRRGPGNNNDSRAKSVLRSPNEADNNFITLPLDRRPHLRVRNNDYSPLDLRRRAYTPLATTTPNQKVARVTTYNDTIIFPMQ